MPPASHPPMQQATMFMPHQAQPAPQVPEVLALLHFLLHILRYNIICINGHHYQAVFRCLDQKIFRLFYRVLVNFLR